MCRRLLALYDLPSWGRCELVLSLLQEPDISYSLEDVVQAVKESHDKDFIRRLLNNECPCCLSIFPLSKVGQTHTHIHTLVCSLTHSGDVFVFQMQSLTSCQCSVCHECFRLHFTIAVRDRHIRDMVCPVCCEPDINDQEQLDSYFSTLDIQVKVHPGILSSDWSVQASNLRLFPAAGLPGHRRLRALPQEADGARPDERPQVPVVLSRKFLFSLIVRFTSVITHSSIWSKDIKP